MPAASIMNTTVLLVDDEEAVLKGYLRNIGDMFEIETASDATTAIAKLEANDRYALIVTDYRMPGPTGVDLLRRARELRPDTVRMLITGYADVNISLQAINEGSIFRMLTKPCDRQSFYRAIEDGLKQHELITSRRELLDQTLNGAVQALGEILSVLDPSAFGRAQKLRLVAREIAKAMDMPELWEVEVAATLSEIGRITLPSSVAGKRLGVTTTEPKEQQLLEHLPEFSSKIIAHIPRLNNVAESVMYQTKNFDGSGFPADRLRGEFIPIGARVLHLTAELILQCEKDRPVPDVLEGFRADKVRFDPKVIQACQKALPILSRILTKVVKVQKDPVPLSGLHVGQILASNIETRDGIILIKAGHIIGPASLQRIQNFATIYTIKEPIYITENFVY